MTTPPRTTYRFMTSWFTERELVIKIKSFGPPNPTGSYKRAVRDYLALLEEPDLSEECKKLIQERIELLAPIRVAQRMGGG
jgi:hypothetical protein